MRLLEDSYRRSGLKSALQGFGPWTLVRPGLFAKQFYSNLVLIASITNLRVLRTPILFITFYSQTLAQEGLRPIRGPIVPGFWEENWYWAVPTILVSAVLLTFFVVWLLKRLNREKPMTPFEIFQDEEKEIQHLLISKKVEEIPARLSRVLREYIEAATGVRAPEQTTEEFLMEVKDGSQIPPGAVRNLNTFLSTLDEAKYARRTLDAAEIKSLVETAVQFVELNEQK
ncbi:MAG: DUF4381 family protein [Verrucomicrobiota bacterium]